METSIINPQGITFRAEPHSAALARPVSLDSLGLETTQLAAPPDLTPTYDTNMTLIPAEIEIPHRSPHDAAQLRHRRSSLHRPFQIFENSDDEDQHVDTAADNNADRSSLTLQLTMSTGHADDCTDVDDMALPGAVSRGDESGFYLPDDLQCETRI